MARYLIWTCLLATTILAPSVSAWGWLNILPNWFNSQKKEEPGHPFSRERIPFDMHLDDIATTVHNEVNGAHSDLFGQVRDFVKGNMSAGAHPRILFSPSEWETMTSKYAFERDTKNHWYKAFLDYTQNKGPGNPLLQKWAAIDTSAYTGESDMDKSKLATLAAEVDLMGEYHEQGMFMCALHATVNEKYDIFNGKGYLPEGQGMGMAINVTVNYAKIVLSHYATYACAECHKYGTCEGCYKYGIKYSDLWSTNRKWSVSNDWLTGGLGIALSYDVLHDTMNAEQRRFVRSAIGIMVTGRRHWGITDVSNAYSPNTVEHPHRIFSNWATYHSNLFLTNLAIEGETDFDTMTSNLVISDQQVGFDHVIHDRSIALYDAFIKHSIYPEGSSFEDGYIYSLALREGSLAFIALAKRGFNHINTQRFRNFMYNNAQMHEPFRCGHFIGHSSGGGVLYPAAYAFFRYSYPDSELNQMMWAQRMGLEFNSNDCRIWWHQTAMQMAVMGMDHPEGMEYDSPQGLSDDLKQYFDLSIYQPRRGILVARNDLTENALYFHFDARPDSFLVGHDNADRGVITLSAFGRTWLDELPWREYYTSQVHSIMHVDGQAQALKAPPVRMLKVSDSNEVVLAAADLTYAMNVQHARAWSTAIQAFHWETEFINGTAERRQIVYTEKETGSPLDYGWPAGDDTSDIGITKNTKMFGEPHLGFSGFYTWKRNYRTVSLRHAVRSTALVRSTPGNSYVIVGDNFAMTGSAQHSFEMYLILAPEVVIIGSSKCDTQPCKCWTNPCMIQLEGGSNRFLTVHASTLGDNVSYRIEAIDNSESTRLIIASEGRNFEKFCTVLHPHEGAAASSNLEVERADINVCSVRQRDSNNRRAFRFLDENHTFESYLVGYPASNESPSPSMSVTPTIIPTPTMTSTPSSSSTPSISMSSTPSSTPSPTISPTPTMTSTPSSSSMPSISMSSTPSSTPSVSVTSTPTASPRPTPSPSSVPGDVAYPADAPWYIQKFKKTIFYEDEFNFFRKSFYNPNAAYEGEVALFIEAATTPTRRKINTCFPETTGSTYITVWDCGAVAEDVAEKKFTERKCTEIPNSYERTLRNGQVTTVRPRKCANKDIFMLDEKKDMLYYIVIGADILNDNWMDVTVKYG